MATGERIRFFRTLRGMTQKYLGLLLGFPESSADVRLAQYESEDRTPKKRKEIPQECGVRFGPLGNGGGH